MFGQCKKINNIAFSCGLECSRCKKEARDGSCGERCTGAGDCCDNPHCVSCRGNAACGCDRTILIPDKFHLHTIDNNFVTEEGGIGMKNEAEKENRPEDESRRKFISGAGLVAGGVVLLGVGGLAVSGCSISGGSAGGEKCTTTATKTTVVNNEEYLGECICPECGITVPHPKGVPCRLVPCPKCGGGMGRYT
jgi:hypothetical protein